MDDSGIDRCPVCLSPATEGAEWVLLSRHRTSAGYIEYCLSACGCITVLRDGDLLKSVPSGIGRASAPRGDRRGAG
ncbi:hypothetical protein ACFY9A_05310 [Streptomyces rubradiris]|uniref:hypothetical protein n=1 Tax=Streptomyces rubradiris TaxID=285531 RepID=UPI0036EED24E